MELLLVGRKVVHLVSWLDVISPAILLLKSNHGHHPLCLLVFKMAHEKLVQVILRCWGNNQGCARNP